jgi:hypothetical protein
MERREFIVVTAVKSDAVDEDPRFKGVGPFVPTAEGCR